MNRILLFIFLISITSCSSNKKNDLEAMNIKGNVLSIIEKTFSDKDSLMKIEELEFNNSGQLVSDKHIYLSQEISMKYENRYNFWGHLIEQKFFEADSLVLKQIYLRTMDKKDSIQIFSSNENLIGIGVINYNNDNRVTESVLYNEVGKVIRNETSKYDNKGNLIKRIVNNLDSLASETTNVYEYDSLNRVNIFSCFVDGEQSQKEKYQYESDEFGNWTDKTVTDKNDMKIKSVKREIKYK